jgi:small subunit ribosomal protein S6
MRKYEVMYIVNASLDDAARQLVIEGLHAIISNNGGTITKIDDWGMKEFAYSIENMTKGYYVVLNIEAEPATVKEFDRLARINNQVVRHMILNLEDE